MTAEITEMTELAHEGSDAPLTRTPVVGTPTRDYPPMVVPDTERVADGEIRVTILGSGDPFVKRAQASASVLIEVGNEQRDFFFFVDHETVGPAFADMRTQYEGPVTIAQDLTTFTITKDAVVARQTVRLAGRWPHRRDWTPHVRTQAASGMVGRRPHHRLTNNSAHMQVESTFGYRRTKGCTRRARRVESGVKLHNRVLHHK